MPMPIHYQQCNLALKPALEWFGDHFSCASGGIGGQEREFERLRSLTKKVQTLIESNPNNWAEQVDLTAVLVRIADFLKPSYQARARKHPDSEFEKLQRMREIILNNGGLYPLLARSKQAAKCWEELVQVNATHRYLDDASIVAARAAAASLSNAIQLSMSVRHPLVLELAFNFAQDQCEIADDEYGSSNVGGYERQLTNTQQYIFSELGYKLPEKCGDFSWLDNYGPAELGAGVVGGTADYVSHYDNQSESDQFHNPFPDPFTDPFPNTPSYSPEYNTNGMPMIADTYIDVTGTPYGSDDNL